MSFSQRMQIKWVEAIKRDGFAKGGYQGGFVMAEVKTVTVTPEMLDDMKVIVASFMSAQIILSGFALVWFVLSSSSIVWAITAPGIVFLYSAVSFWIVCNAWKSFKTKLLVLN